MATSDTSEATLVLTNNPRSTAKTITGTPLVAVCVVWLTVALGLLALFISLLPATYQARETFTCNNNGISLLGWSTASCATLFVGLDIVYAAVFVIVATLIFWRKPGDRVATFSSFSLIFFGIVSAAPFTFALESTGLLGLVINVAYAIAMILLLVFFYIFPNGHFAAPWTRVAAVICSLYFFVGGIFPSLNPFNSSILGGILSITLIFGLCLISQFQRYRHFSTPTQRQQTKWVLFGAATGLILYAVANVFTNLVVAVPTKDLTVMNYLGYFVGNSGNYFSLMLIPISIAMSIFRFRLWEIDIMINRTLIGGVVTAILAVIFVMGVVLIEQVARMVTGGQQSSVAVAISALLVAGAFNPTRNRLRTVIDGYFYPKYLEKALKVTTPEENNSRSNSSAGILTGQRAGVYEILDPLGRGGMSEVYRGRHTTLNRPVAIKILTAKLSEQDSFRKRFEREAQTVAALRHDNIVQVFDFGELGETYYMVMEFIDGQTLAHYLHQVKRMTLEASLPLLKGIADALDYAHSQGVIHRDVKPGNVMLQSVTGGTQFRPVLMDFGIAKMRETGDGLTSTGMLGTLDYVAPEQILASSTIDGRADVYALGIMTYQMMTGILPFRGDNAGALVLAHLQKAPLDPRKVVGDISENTAKTILCALAKEPSDRFSSAGDFVLALSH